MIDVYSISHLFKSKNIKADQTLKDTQLIDQSLQSSQSSPQSQQSSPQSSAHESILSSLSPIKTILGAQSSNSFLDGLSSSDQKTSIKSPFAPSNARIPVIIKNRPQ